MKLIERANSAKERGRRLVDHWRVRRHWIDHLIRTVQRYQLLFGDRLAGAVTYFAFLSFFPLIVLAFSIFGFVLADNAELKAELNKAIADQLPGVADKLDLQAIADSRASAGIIALIGLAYAGLGAVDALRGSLREMYMTTTPPLNFFLGKLRDVASLLMVGATLLASALVTGFATTATRTVAGWLGLQDVSTVWFTGTLASLLADWLMFVIVLGWVARPVQPFKVIARGALLGAIGFGILKQLASLLLGHTLGNPIYGTFAVMVGLLVWINFSARLVLYVAAWTATAGMNPPPSPTPPPGNGDSHP
ncbi:YihY/virulence factor BrkB family protein [Nonomuraea soli]|uniref:Membrane protein n=1 Tax=Nonomuraea soli TaxID=1032476 RepID=A0A7W0HQZ8_9ACTN|nr:YihY/virulence factor BrkB family protein [Nonomuraea soli]MBA2892420.1 membrane protein [Nonomuraea soli]